MRIIHRKAQKETLWKVVAL